MAAFTAAISLIFLIGCTKDGNGPGSTPVDQDQKMGNTVTDKATQKRIDEVIASLPPVAVFNEKRNEYILLDMRADRPKFDFASPSAGWSFSSPQGTIEFVQGPDGSFYQVVTPGGGSGMGGGTVTAGSIALDVSMVMCFNSGDDAFGGLFDVGDFSGFSGAVGIAGDFEALANGEVDDDADFTTYFQGVVGYYAFDGTASGSYPVLDFFDVENDVLNPNNKAIAWLWAFTDGGGIFFSKSGNVTFSGASVDFNGIYWGITGFSLNFDDEFDEDDFNYVEVPGFGALNCQ